MPTIVGVSTRFDVWEWLREEDVFPSSIVKHLTVDDGERAYRVEVTYDIPYERVERARVLSTWSGSDLTEQPLSDARVADDIVRFVECAPEVHDYLRARFTDHWARVTA